MNQNGKHTSACIWDSKSEKYNIVVPNFLIFVNDVFNLQKFHFMFSRSFRNIHSLVI